MSSDPPHSSPIPTRAPPRAGWCLRLDDAFFAGPRSELDRHLVAFTYEPEWSPSARAEEGEVSVLVDGELRSGDAGSVLALYRERGIDGLSRLRGRFACVVVDRRRRLLIAQRDPLGHQPLFWSPASTAGGPGILISDSIDALGDGSGGLRGLDRTAVAGFLCNRWPAPAETFYRSIRRVRPGFLLIGRPSGFEERRYWRLEAPRAESEWLCDEEADRFPELFDRAVARRCTEPPVAVSLSSGLDSVSVAVSAVGTARRLGAPPPRAVCLGFSPPECDERDDQRRIAALLGMDATFSSAPVPATTSGPLHELVELAPHLASPPVNPLLPSFRRLYEAARCGGATTVLTGNGGDEWMGVSPLLGADHLRTGRWRELWELGRSVQRSVRLPAARVWWNQLWRFGARPLLSDAAARRLGPRWSALRERRTRGRMPPWLRPEVARELIERVRAEKAPGDAADHRSFYWREIERSVDHPLVSMTQEEVYDSAGQAGVALRAPFEDDEMVEHLVRIPPRKLLQGGRSKGLVREYLRGRLPEIDLQHQRKVSFTALFCNSVRREAEDCLVRLGGFEALAELGVVEPRRLRRAVEHARRLESGSATLPIWSAIVLESWARREVRP